MQVDFDQRSVDILVREGVEYARNEYSGGAELGRALVFEGGGMGFRCLA